MHRCRWTRRGAGRGRRPWRRDPRSPRRRARRRGANSRSTRSNRGGELSRRRPLTDLTINQRADHLGTVLRGSSEIVMKPANTILAPHGVVPAILIKERSRRSGPGSSSVAAKACKWPISAGLRSARVWRSRKTVRARREAPCVIRRSGMPRRRQSHRSTQPPPHNRSPPRAGSWRNQTSDNSALRSAGGAG